MPSTKCEGLSYPTHFLKNWGSVIRNNFIEYRTKQATLFARRNDFDALFATIKAKHILNRHFSCSCGESLHFLYFSTFFLRKCVNRASSARIIYLNKK